MTQKSMYGFTLKKWKRMVRVMLVAQGKQWKGIYSLLRNSFFAREQEFARMIQAILSTEGDDRSLLRVHPKDLYRVLQYSQDSKFNYSEVYDVAICLCNHDLGYLLDNEVGLLREYIRRLRISLFQITGLRFFPL